MSKKRWRRRPGDPPAKTKAKRSWSAAWSVAKLPAALAAIPRGPDLSTETAAAQGYTLRVGDYFADPRSGEWMRCDGVVRGLGGTAPAEVRAALARAAGTASHEGV